TSSATTYATTTTFVYTDSTSTPSSIKRTDWLFPSNTVDSYQYFDGLNRLIQERKTSPTAGTYSVSDRKYDGALNLHSQSLPYFNTGTSFTSPTSTAALYTNFLYDPLKRITSSGTIVGTTTNAYSKWTTTTTDSDANIKDYTFDAFGNLGSVVE